MKKRKLRKFVLPTIYTIAISALFVSVVLIGKTIESFSEDDMNSYVVNSLLDDQADQVMNVTNTSIIKPFTAEGVKVEKTFYNKYASEEEQQNSLIYYENTYMQNSGELYISENAFDIVVVLDGTITDIKEDELLGNVIEIEHNSNLKTTYQSVDNIAVKVGDEVKQGDIIATSGANKIYENNKNCLLFEVYKDGQLLNPQDFYTMDTKALEN